MDYLIGAIAFCIVFFLVDLNKINNEVSHMKRTLDKIAIKIGAVDREPEKMNEELQELIDKGKKNKAIQLYRTETGEGLKEAKEYIDSLSEKNDIK